MIKYLMTFFVLVVLFSFGSVTTASACEREATGACVAAGKASTLPAVRGPKAPTVGPMACLYVLVDPNMTGIVLLAGARVKNSPVLTFIRASSGHILPDTSRGIALKEFCFPRSLIRGLKAITICNGDVPGDGNHHVLRGIYLTALQKYGHAGDYLSLLGVARTESGDILSTYDEDLYTQQYGFNLR